MGCTYFFTWVYMTGAQIRKYAQCSFVCSATAMSIFLLTDPYIYIQVLFILLLLCFIPYYQFLIFKFVICHHALSIFSDWKRERDNAHIHTELRCSLYGGICVALSDSQYSCYSGTIWSAVLMWHVHRKHLKEKQNLHFFTVFMDLLLISQMLYQSLQPTLQTNAFICSAFHCVPRYITKLNDT